jgi:prolycopene isomerase
VSKSQRVDSHWDVIVIGSGLGGLSAATRLSQSGLRVLVLEQHEFSGGYAHHFLRKVRGTKIVYDFDVALHQTGDLAPGRQMNRLLNSMGVLEQLKVNRFDIAYRTRGPAHDLQIPADADDYEALLCDSYPEHAGGVRDLFQALREIDAPGPDGGMSPTALATLNLSLQDFMDQHVRDERIQAIFATLWGYLGLLPSEASAFLYARLWSSYHFGGCFYFQGGGQALADTFVNLIEANRGRVLLRTAVTGIGTHGGRICSVETKKRGTFHAPVVVSNASAPQTFHDLLDDPGLASADLERVDGLPIACSIHQAYVGIRGDAAKIGMPDRGAFFNHSYDWSDEAEGLATSDYSKQGWLTGNHNIADPGHPPPGRSILHAAVLARGDQWMDLDETEYREKKREIEEHLIDKLALAIPDIRERIEICEVGTPRTMMRYSWNPQGSIYGYASTPTSHSIHRPDARTSVPGLYLAGSWTFPSAGFTGTMMSGYRTAGLIFEDHEGSRPDPQRIRDTG